MGLVYESILGVLLLQLLWYIVGSFHVVFMRPIVVHNRKFGVTTISILPLRGQGTAAAALSISPFLCLARSISNIVPSCKLGFSYFPFN